MWQNIPSENSIPSMAKSFLSLVSEDWLHDSNSLSPFVQTRPMVAQRTPGPRQRQFRRHGARSTARKGHVANAAAGFVVAGLISQTASAHHQPHLSYCSFVQNESRFSVGSGFIDFFLGVFDSNVENNISKIWLDIELGNQNQPEPYHFRFSTLNPKPKRPQ